MTDFLTVARARGLVIDHVNADGKIQRVPVEGKPKKDAPGWYVYHAGGTLAYAVFGRWDDGLPDETWMERSDAPPTAAEKKQMQETRLAIRKETESGYSKAAADVRALFDKTTEANDAHAYLQKKRVKAFGLRVDSDALLIPLRDAGGVLWSLQRVFPNGEKRFHPGGRCTGCFHWLGDPAGASWLLLAEGYATAATIHEATGLPVAAAMNCGNLLPVAQSLAAKYPNARFLICADDDRATKEKTGKNPGVDAARATVLALNKGQQKGQKRARFVAPEGLKEGGSDFNDLAAASGLDAVKQQIEAAIGGKPKWPQAQEPKGGDGGVSVPPSLDRSRPRFAVNDDGVWYSGVDKEGNQLPPFLVCSPLHVTARTRDAESLEWGYLLEVPDYEGTPHQWAMPARLLAGDGNEYRSNLLSMGLRITPGSSAKNLLTQYLQTVKVDAFARCVDVTGWHDRVFVLPDRAIGNTAEKYIFQSAAAVNNTFKQKGSAEEWKEHIGKHCAGNSRLAFAVSVAFAGALLKLTGLESGGFHFRGHSGIGKTCALRVASSVYGGENFMQRWRATDNAMEGMATQHSDTVLVLDEIGQADPKVIGECVYMFSNDAGKGRASRTGAPRARMTWRLLFFSSGEKTLAEHMGEANKRVNAGQEVRLCDIPADTGSGFHLFENLGDFPGAKELHRHFMDKTRAYYGAVGIAWLQRLAADFDALPERIKALREKVVAKMVPSVASGQVYRAADRFALVAVAGELATEYGLTGWERGEAVKAAEVCFSAWLESRGGLVAVEEMQMLAQARRFLEQNDNRFTWCGRALDDHAPSIPNRCGFKRTFRDGKPYEYKGKDDAAQPDELVTVYYVLPESFKNELCKGFDLKAMCRLLRDSGVLECGKDSFTRSERLPGLGNVRCYRIVPAKFDDDLNGADDAGTDAAEVNGYSSAPDDDCPF